mmetsp:Transcript_29828/g.62535  ORF Transcript_29828/g.62535 Transcript_29828/m.62535 type:complete len:103 (+) Transcript_29828:810-1118(+)
MKRGLPVVLRESIGRIRFCVWTVRVLEINEAATETHELLLQRICTRTVVIYIQSSGNLIPIDNTVFASKLPTRQLQTMQENLATGKYATQPRYTLSNGEHFS